MKIPFVDLKRNYKSMKPEIDKAIKQTIDNTAFIMGDSVSNFEKNFANFCDVKYCVGVSSGTSAIELALRALNIGKGDEVITTPLTFIATVEAIVNVGAKPVFVDIDPWTYNINVNQIPEKLTGKTKAILPVHLYGNPAEIKDIMDIAEENDLYVVEDCAQAHGAQVDGKNVGTFGNIGCFSFYPGKNLGAFGDAGAIISNDEEITNRVKMLRDHGREDKYEHQIIGYNQRIDALQASILDVKLRYLTECNKKRKVNAIVYNSFLKDHVQKVPLLRTTHNSVFHLYVIQVENRDELRAYLKSKGISSGIHYPIPLHLQPALSGYGYRKGDFLVAEYTCKNILSLPMFPDLIEEEIQYVCESILEFKYGN